CPPRGGGQDAAMSRTGGFAVLPARRTRGANPFAPADRRCRSSGRGRATLESRIRCRQELPMDFTLPEELRMLRDTVARFVREEMIPLEKEVIRREAERGLTDAPLIAPDVEDELARK